MTMDARSNAALSPPAGTRTRLELSPSRAEAPRSLRTHPAETAAPAHDQGDRPTTARDALSRTLGACIPPLPRTRHAQLFPARLPRSLLGNPTDPRPSS